MIDHGISKATGLSRLWSEVASKLENKQQVKKIPSACVIRREEE